MGLRVRVVLVVLSLLAIAALAVPLALSLADRRTATLAAERDRQLAALADAAAMPGSPAAAPGRPLLRGVRRRRAHRRLRRPDPGRTRTQYLRTRMWRRRRTTPSSTQRRRRGPASCRGTDGTVLATAGVRSDGELVGAVVVAVDTTVAARDVGTGWSWVAVGCLGLLVLAALVGSCAHEVGAAPAQRAGARRRRDDRRSCRAARRRGRAAGTAPLHCGVQHDGTGGAGLPRSSTATRRRRVAPVAQSVGRRPVCARTPSRTMWPRRGGRHTAR